MGTFGLLRVVSNIDRVDIWGGEASATFRPVKGWQIFASGNVLGSEILKNAARPDTVGNSSPYTSDYTFNIGTQLEPRISDRLSLLFRMDARLTGPTWFSTVQAQTRPTLFGVPGDYSRTRRDQYAILNGRVGLVSRAGWTIAATATNLLDERYLEEVIPAPRVSAAASYRPGSSAGSGWRSATASSAWFRPRLIQANIPVRRVVARKGECHGRISCERHSVPGRSTASVARCDRCPGRIRWIRCGCPRPRAGS